MTVRDLIEELKEYPLDAKVFHERWGFEPEGNSIRVPLFFNVAWEDLIEAGKPALYLSGQPYKYPAE